jgi:hypothetical protein
MPASSREVRKARAFLQGRKLGSRDVSPRFFANAAKELDITFNELLRLIARLMLGGQAQSRIRLELLEQEVSK